eukprot:358645-Chlamydomonas_euryale.AAC.2
MSNKRAASTRCRVFLLGVAHVPSMAARPACTTEFTFGYRIRRSTFAGTAAVACKAGDDTAGREASAECCRRSAAAGPARRGDSPAAAAAADTGAATDAAGAADSIARANSHRAAARASCTPCRGRAPRRHRKRHGATARLLQPRRSSRCTRTPGAAQRHTRHCSLALAAADAPEGEGCLPSFSSPLRSYVASVSGRRARAQAL